MSLKNFFVPVALLLMLVGCEKQGPLERFGEEVDEAVEDVASRRRDDRQQDRRCRRRGAGRCRRRA